MKTLIKQSLVVVTLCAALTSYASSVESLVMVKEADEKAFSLIVSSLNPQQFQIFIKDKNDVTLYEENLQVGSGISKKYNLKALPRGNYFLEVINEQVIKTMPFEISESQVFFDPSNETEIYKPFIRQRGKMVDVMFKGADKSATKVMIFNNHGHLLLKEKIKAGSDLERIYDFSNLPKGTYEISFFRGHIEFHEKITITE